MNSQDYTLPVHSSKTGKQSIQHEQISKCPTSIYFLHLHSKITSRFKNRLKKNITLAMFVVFTDPDQENRSEHKMASHLIEMENLLENQ